MSLSARRRANAEALEGTQQIEARVLGIGFRMDDLRQLAGERRLPSDSPKAVLVLGVLIVKENISLSLGMKANPLN